MHTAYHRREVRREHESFGDAVLKPGDGLPDFGQVAVSGCAVGFEVVAGFAQQRTDIAFPARAGHAGFAVGNQRHTGLQTALPQQRHERQGYAGRVAAGVGDEARLCDGFAVEFAQSVHGLGNEAGGGVGHAVPVFPGRNVPYAEVGGKVDDAHALKQVMSSTSHAVGGTDLSRSAVKPSTSLSVPSHQTAIITSSG